MGLCPGAEEIFSALKGLRTLDLRMARHQENGFQLARWLQTRPEVDEVLHPALPFFRGHDIWERDFTGSCGLFSVLLNPVSDEALAAFFKALQLFGIGWSWGGYESLIVPLQMDNARTVTRWQGPGPLLRIHAGLEDIDDLKEDMVRGFYDMCAADG